MKYRLRNFFFGAFYMMWKNNEFHADVYVIQYVL